MSEGSFPHHSPLPEPPDGGAAGEPVEAPPETGRVLEFPTDERARPEAEAPVGTWADEPPAAGTAGDEDVGRLLRPAGVGRWEGGEVVAFPSVPSTQTRKRPSFVRERQARGEAREPQARPPSPATGAEPAPEDRPKFLASELLHEDWFPRTPLRRTLRWGSVGAGVLGVGTVIAVTAGLGLGAFGLDSLALSVLFALCAIAGLAPLTAEQRGAALTLVGAAGASWLGVLSTSSTDAAATPLLLACVTLTVAALLFRAAHRTSRLARALLAVGLLATAGYLVLSGGIAAMTVESMEWQAWVVPASRWLLAAVVLVSALSFLDPTGHGGAWALGVAFLVWLALDATGLVALAAWPARAPAAAVTAERWFIIGALPIFAAVTAGGLCQLLALVSHRLHGAES